MNKIIWNLFLTFFSIVSVMEAYNPPRGIDHNIFVLDTLMAGGIVTLTILNWVVSFVKK